MATATGDEGVAAVVVVTAAAAAGLGLCAGCVLRQRQAWGAGV